jgi:hypothetical protein
MRERYMKKILFVVCLHSYLFTNAAYSASNDIDRMINRGVEGAIGAAGLIIVVWGIKIIISILGAGIETTEKIVKSIKINRKKTQCPHCKTMFYIKKEYINKSTTCQKCGNKYIIEEVITLKSVD